MENRKYYLFILIFFLSFLSVFSQTRRELEAQRKKLKKEINQVNRLLFNEKKRGKNALEDLYDINQKIKIRAQLISTINTEAAILSKEISKNQTTLKNLDKKLADLKKDYADLILKSYKSKSQQSRAMFLLSSKNFYQAYKRLEYMKQYTAFRKKQGEDIVIQTNFIKQLNDSLIFQKIAKDTLIISKKQQKKEIEVDRQEQKKLISIIKKKESSYRKKLRDKIKEEKKVTAIIDKKIRDEINKANKVAKSTLKSKPKSVKKDEFILSPEAKALATKFELNKGKLPWPVNKGVVVRKFGRQPHPSFPGITINGTGLHIITQKGEKAAAIFSGKVLNVLVSSEGRKNVLIQHGNYISSYNNLENIYVKKGDNIVTGQNIGEIFTDKVSKKTKLIFVLFKNTKRLNPSSWILKR